MTSLRVEAKLHVDRGRAGRKTVTAGESTVFTVSPALPRVARLLALAHRFDQLVRDGLVADYADLARLGRVSRTRVTQIMNLLSLAPDIQEAILCGGIQVNEREMRQVAAELGWGRQRRVWGRLGRREIQSVT